MPVPLQLQVLEADFLDATKSGAIGAGRLVQGIEFDPVGKRRAYCLHAEHPGDAYGALQNGLQIRAGLVEFRRQIDAVQWQLFIPMFCAPVWRWFTEAAWAAGQIPSPTVPVEWSPPKFEAVDPQKDAMANLLSIRSGTMTLAEVIAKQGRNPDAVLAEIAATNAKLDALGLVLDSDPRRVTKTGSAQTNDPATDPADNDPTAEADETDPAQADQQDSPHGHEDRTAGHASVGGACAEHRRCRQGAYIETRNGFDVDGVEIKCRLDFGAKAIDWRGLYKNPGA